MFAYEEKKVQGKKNPIQRAQVANIECPAIGDPMAIGSTIHGILRGRYLNYGHAGAGNARQAEQTVPSGHVVDLAVRNLATNTITRFGEVKPRSPAGLQAGRGRIDTVVQNNPALNQVNVAGWVASVAADNINLNAVDPGVHIVGHAHTGNERLRIQQEGGGYQGLYRYYGI